MQPAARPPIALIGATVFDGRGGSPIENATLLIEGARIAAVGDHSLPVPGHAQTLNVQGKYITPGLMDANVHLVLDIWPLTMVRFEGRYDELAIEAAQIALRSGVTTVFDTWGPRAALIKARDQINAGSIPGARIYLAGNIVGLGGPYSADFFSKGREVLFDRYTGEINALWEEGVGPELVWKSPADVAAAVRDHARRGIDFVKFAVTTHTGDMQHIQFSPRVQSAIVDAAHEAGLTAQSHSTTNEGLDMAMSANVDLMQHIDLTYGREPIPRALIDAIARRGVPGALLPETARALEWFRESAVRTPFLKRHETMDRNARAAIHGGITLLLSTDGGVFSRNTRDSAYWRSWVPPEDGLIQLGAGHINWLRAVEEKGMPAMAALQSATRNIARAYHVDDDLGTLEPGKLADLVIYDRNPLERAEYYGSVSAVIKEGRLVDRDALPTRRLLTMAEPEIAESR